MNLKLWIYTIGNLDIQDRCLGFFLPGTEIFLQPSVSRCFHRNVSPGSICKSGRRHIGAEWVMYGADQANKQNLTFLGLRGTRSLSLFIPGIITVILLGPFIPNTFVSCCHKYIKKKTHFLLVLTLKLYVHKCRSLVMSCFRTHVDDAR